MILTLVHETRGNQCPIWFINAVLSVIQLLQIVPRSRQRPRLPPCLKGAKIR
jgi:hypothetical protein